MKNYILLLLLLWTLPSQGQTQKLLQSLATKKDLQASILPIDSWVKYPQYTNRHEWSKLFGKDKKHIITQAEKQLNYSWQAVTATSYLEFERSGNREAMEVPFNANIKAISSLLLGELAEGKGRFIDALVDGVYFTCEMTSWSLAAHQIMQPTHRALPTPINPVIDLVSGDLSSLLAWTYYFLHEEFDKIDPSISERIKFELKSKTLEPYMDGEKYWWIGFGEAANGLVNNWNPWCNSNILQTALLIEEDSKKQAEIIHKTMKSVDYFLSYIKSDGACEEGPSYWGHAAGKTYDYLQILFDATGGQISLFDKPMIKAMGEYIYKSYIGDGWVVNFADAEARASLDYRLIYRFGRAVDSQAMLSFASYLQSSHKKPITINRDIYRMLSSLGSDHEIAQFNSNLTHAPYSWYPETEFCYIYNKPAFFASKGGHNDESHNHNDVGSFILYLDNHPLFIDVGVETYTAKTFSSKRYEIWTMQSDYHNLPLINGVSQKNGRKFKAENSTFNLKRKLFKTNIQSAYPDEAQIDFWERSYQVGKRKTVISDSYRLKALIDHSIINFMTWKKPQLERDGLIAVPYGKEKKAHFSYDSKQFDVEIQTINLDDPRLTKIWGEVVYRISLTAKSKTLSNHYKYTITY